MRHHTKDKGDTGVACIIADLAKHDIQVALPISEHLPFDLIAVHPSGRLLKVSVKYRTMTKDGALLVRAYSVWNDRHGTHYRPHRAGDYDGLAIYCPDTDECYYLLPQEVPASGAKLRVADARNNQIVGVRKARWFREPDRLITSAPVAQRIEQPVSTRFVEGSTPSGGAQV
jgi:hypothetical protein